MATYKEIRGSQIEAVATDPTNPVEGQVWYNTTSNVLKGQAATTAGSWASGGTMNTARGMSAFAGTQTATLATQGVNNATDTALNVTESYNGTNWTEVNDANLTRTQLYGSGTQTSALIYGGYLGPPGNTPDTESWNGTNWTEVNDMNTARYALWGVGADSTSALAIGGADTAITGKTESYNGTNWTEVNDLNTARATAGGAGTSTSSIAMGGQIPGSPGRTANAELWNGTNWTEVNNMNSPRRAIGGLGTSTSALAVGGDESYPPGTRSTKNEEWNGSNFVELADLSGAREYAGASGTTAAGLAGAGRSPPTTSLATTEEWTGAGAGVTRTFTDS